MGGSSAPAAAGNYTALLVSSLIVLALLATVLWALTRWKHGRRGRLGVDATGMLHVRARLTLEPQRTLYVVTVGDKSLLLGVGEQGINVVTDLSTQTLPVQPPALTFAELVRSTWTRKGAAASRVPPRESNTHVADDNTVTRAAAPKAEPQ